MSKTSDTTDEMQSFKFDAIAIIESPYREKFAIPRQPNLVSAAKGKVVLIGAANNHELVRDIEQFSHLWLLFVFHGTQAQGWKPLVRPPRLGGNKKIGVLATRSTFRPNPIGMSVVKLDGIRQTTLANGDRQVIIDISGLDLLNGTPIVDIKPYLPYCDSIVDANASFAQAEPSSNITVSFTQKVTHELKKYQGEFPELQPLISQVLAQDPRPAYKKDKVDDKVYGMSLYRFNIQWQMTSTNQISVINIEANPEISDDINNKSHL